MQLKLILLMWQKLFNKLKLTRLFATSGGGTVWTMWPTHFFNCGGLAHPLFALLSFVFVLLITTDHQLFPGLAHPLSKSFRRRCLPH